MTQTKLNAYRLAAPLIAISAWLEAIAHALWRPTDPLALYSHIGLAMTFSIGTIRVWLVRHVNKNLEILSVVICLIYILINMYASLRTVTAASDALDIHLHVTLWGLLVVLLNSVMFLIFQPSDSLKLALGIAACTLLIGVPYMVQHVLIAFHLSQFYLLNALSISLLWSISSAYQRYALFDFLTEIYNRRYLYEALHHVISNAQRYRRPFSMILLDIDHFKQINDTYGHPTGDFVLQQTVQLIKPLLRNADVLGRWGGEEFLIIMPETDIQSAGIVAERLRQAIAQHVYARGGRVTASFGVAAFRTGETTDELLHRTDAALYEAKNGGRNKIVLNSLEASDKRMIENIS